ncbi:hypothetical protein UY3_12323 [Chelonia mydas]|uniref:Uncharacterized protein n=1 Tax=Chelonia mydas TaxID=8469 RepID=M7BQZ8_CHEMY|nr:hypothetical protein UY3_12323 [Chelonia mydas]
MTLVQPGTRQSEPDSASAQIRALLYSSPVARTVPGQAGPNQQRHQPHTAAPGTSTTEPAAGSSDTAVTHHTLTYPPRGDMDPAVPGEL